MARPVSAPGPDKIFEVNISGSGQRRQIEAINPFSDRRPVAEEITLPPPENWKVKLAELQQAIRPRIPSTWPDPRENIAARINSPSTLPIDAEGVAFRDAPGGPGNLASIGAVKYIPPRIIKEIGEDLFSLLFTRKIYSAYTASVEEADDTRTPLRIRFCFRSPGLSYLPWETLHDGIDHVALSTRSPIVRASRQDDSVSIKPVRPPIGVLGMVPRVRQFGKVTLGNLDVSTEQANIEAALRGLTGQKKAVLGWASGTASDLTARLQHPPEGCQSWHVFHFIGHGGFEEDQFNMGYIIVDPDPTPVGMKQQSEGAEALYADDLKHILDNSQGLRLVILNSCRGATGTPEAASAAENLVARGFSAVVAMQFEISDVAAIWFSSALYQQLAAGSPIHVAVTVARQHLKRRSPEWVTPVLYMRSRDGVLFRE